MIKCLQQTHITIPTGSNTIIAPPKQYALINTMASLNCSTTYGESNRIVTSWYRDLEQTQPAGGEFDSVGLGHEGMYVCELYLPDFEVETIKMINFSVIGKIIQFALYIHIVLHLLNNMCTVCKKY